MPHDFPLVTVQPHRGAPTLFIDGRAVFPLLLMSSAAAIEEMKQIQPCDIHLLTESLPLGWVGVDRYDLGSFDAAMRHLLRVDPRALVLPRLMIDAPADWMDAHPGEVVDYADPAGHQDTNGWGGARHPSWASRAWRDDASEALRRLIRHARASDYAPHILGWHLGSGIYGEWHAWNAVYYPDTSPAFVAAFEKWLAQRYPGERRPPRIPTLEERRHGTVGMFRDPIEHACLVDHAEFFHQVGAAALAEFARVVHEESGGRSMVLAFNGYVPDLGVDGHEIDHRAFERTLRNPHVHCFSSPHSYVRRAPGEDGMIRGFLGSVRAMGKLWIDEADDRTSLAHESQWKHCRSVEESVEVLWRSFAQALTNNCGLWFMDQGGLWRMEHERGWYQHPQILAALNQMQAVAEASMSRPRTRAAQLAVVASFKTAFHLADRSSGLDAITDTLINPALAAFTRLGAPWDLYLLNELFEPTVPDYEAYAFLDTFFMSDAELARVRALRDRGKTMLFFYAPAFIGERGLSLQRMRDLLGMDVQMIDAMELPNGKQQRPGFAVAGAGTGVAQQGKVIYSPGAPLPAATLRGLLAPAGVHVYLDSDDTLMVGGGYVAIHAASNGSKVLRHTNATDWHDVRTGATVARGTAEVTLDVARGQTVLLSLGAP